GSTAAEAAEATAATAAALAFLAAGLVALALSICCPELPHPLGGPEAFRGPFSPWVPAIGTAISWILLTQLSWASLRWTLWAVGAVSLWYFTYGAVIQKQQQQPGLAKTETMHSFLLCRKAHDHHHHHEQQHQHHDGRCAHALGDAS
ncbi:unnamed protein product, partial [Ectocarpus sp. 4 AP-2014]